MQRIVVVGASAGGVAALENLAAGLPADFPAPVLIVLHVGPRQPALLPEILSRAGPLPAVSARSGRIGATGIHVSRADHHLVIDRDRLLVTRGPRDNAFRPSIDVLFRSAAYHFGPRAIGVVLSGLLSDGASGLYAIRRLGGIAVVQDPREAQHRSMPERTIAQVDVHHVLRASQIGGLLNALVLEPVAAAPPDGARYRQALKAGLDAAAANPV